MNFKVHLLMELQMYLHDLPFMTTEQAARAFPHLKWPQKEASKYLKELEEQKLVEGYDRRVGQSKLWRLTRKGRKELGVKKRAVPFTIRNIEHYLAVGDCYLDCFEIGGKWIEAELREDFVSLDGKMKKYCPDGFFIYENQPYFLEVQRSYLSRQNWVEKWKMANEFFGEGHHADCSVNEYIKDPLVPIVVVTNQRKEVVETGVNVPLIVVEKFKDFKERAWS